MEISLEAIKFNYIKSLTSFRDSPGPALRMKPTAEFGVLAVKPVNERSPH
jgi:hypothetical protein